MFNEICSNYHEEYIGKGDSMVHVNVRYWVDIDNTYWYSYDDICDLVGLNNKIANKWFKYDIPTNHKCTCMDSNNYDQYNTCQPILTDFVTGETARLVVQQHANYVSARDNNIIKSLNNLECVGNAYEVFQDAEEIKQRKKLILDSIENDDYEEFFVQCYKVSQTKSSRKVLSDKGVIVEGIEEALDQISEYLYASETKFIIGKNNKGEDIWFYDNN